MTASQTSEFLIIDDK